MRNRFQGDPGARPTVNDVARAAGVSTATVSRVLNDSPEVSSALRARVEAAIEALGYVRDSTARALAMKRSLLLGVIRSASVDPARTETVSAFSATAEAAGYGVLESRLDGDGAARTALRHLLEHGVDGVFVAEGVLSAADATLLTGRDLPIVSCSPGAPTSASPFARVALDLGALDQLATTLAAYGHLNVAVVSDPAATSPAVGDFIAAIGVAFERCGLTLVATMALGGDVAAGRRALAALSGLEPRPSAVVCANDLLGLGVLIEAGRVGLAVPAALSVIGCGDLDLARAFVPPLATIGVDATEIGRVAADCLVAGVEDRPAAALITVGSSFIVRASVGPAPTQPMIPPGGQTTTPPKTGPNRDHP